MAAPTTAAEAPRLDASREAWWRTLLRRVGTAAGVQVVAVPDGATSVAVTFARREPDTAYGVLATATWDTTVWISSPTTDGCTLNFTAPVGAQTCTVMIVREA